MTEWTFELFPDAQDDLRKLDNSQRRLVYRALLKLKENPLPKSKGGYGEELRNQNGINLAGYLKLKLRGLGIRIVYDVKEEAGKSYVIVIGMREDKKVYKTAARRIEKYEVWFNSLTDLLGESNEG